MSNQKADYSFVRIEQHTAKTVGNSERHNERKNENYSNDDVDLERTHLNVHFKDPEGKSYFQILREMEAEGKVSERGLREDATAPLLQELIDHIDVYEAEGIGKNKTQRIVIYYRFVGYLEIPEISKTSYKADTRQGVSVEYLTEKKTA